MLKKVDEKLQMEYYLCMKRIGLFFVLPLVLFFSCASGPPPASTAVQAEPVNQVPATQAAPPAQAEPAVPQAAPQPPAVQPAPPQPAPQPAPPPAPAPAPQPAPQPAPPPAPVTPPPAVNPTPNEEHFDPGSITQEKLEKAKEDVQALIADLNKIIRAKNYNAWRGYLSDSYFEEINSAAFLQEKTDELYRRDQIVAQNLGRDPKKVTKKVLRSPKDYFDNVVVPSRSNDRMDDLAFVTENRVKAYTIDNRGNRVVLYDLEIINGKWKIIN